MLHRKIINAIYKINPNAQFGLSGDSWEEITFQWTNNTTPISKTDIEAQFTIVEFDMAMQDLRNERDKLLANTDYLALSDNTMSDEMKAYRQALRDITNGLTTKDEVEAVVFPTKP